MTNDLSTVRVLFRKTGKFKASISRVRNAGRNIVLTRVEVIAIFHMNHDRCAMLHLMFFVNNYRNISIDPDNMTAQCLLPICSLRVPNKSSGSDRVGFANNREAHSIFRYYADMLLEVTQ